MSELVWDQAGMKEYETGTSNVVLYTNKGENSDADKAYNHATAWSGATGVTETPEGAEPTDLYADNVKYLTLRSAEKLNLTLTAYMYPDEWGECDGSASPVKGMKIYQQERKGFGLAYKTIKGNDADGDAYGYILHLVYGCSASPSERGYKTVNDSPEAIEFSYGITTTPVSVKIGNKTYKPTSLITIDSTDFTDEDGKAALKALEDVLFGTETEEAYLPTPAKVAALLGGASALG